MFIGEEVTSDWLKRELAAAEGKLKRTERKRQHNDDVASALSPLQRLTELNDEVNCLEISHDMAVWGSIPESSVLTEEAQKCVDLGHVLCRHRVPPPKSSGRRLYDSLLQEQYEPLYRYVRSKLIVALRETLRKAGYPSEEGCSKLSNDFDTTDASSFGSYCKALARLQQVQIKVAAHLDGTLGQPSVERSCVIVEFCRPLVERVLFHFVAPAEERVTSKRTERLPEWLLGYIREHAMEGGPWDLVCDKLTTIVEDAQYQFLGEMVQLAGHVLQTRNFFRHEVIAGPNSNPLHLMRGIEQLLRFDAYVRDLVPEKCTPVGLSQSMVAADEDLFHWWLDREKESALSTMFDTEITQRPPGRITPRSELFCALIYSIETKASLFDTPGQYLSHVAVPLCMSYLDAIHTSATDLRGLLSQRKLPSDHDLKLNMEEWIELINGIHMASLVLNKEDAGRFGRDDDLARVGRSYERMKEAMVDECANTIVETVLMERTKLASYLMRCSHLFANTNAHSVGLSSDLQEVARVVAAILDAFDAPGLETNETDQFAPTALKTNVLDRLADKFLEVALDAHGMTPELVLNGCLVVSEDVKTLLAGRDSPFVRRLFDVMSFMTMDSKQMHALRMALFGLVQTSTYPDPVPMFQLAQFSSDGTVLDEAVSMVRAKGYGLHLEDALSILNRRKDSFL